MISLHSRNGSTIGQTFSLADFPAAMGTSPECGLVIAEDGIESWHAHLSMESGEIVVRDYGTGSGVFVNGTKVESAILQNGDILNVGWLEFGVEIPAADPEPAIPAPMSPPENPGKPVVAKVQKPVTHAVRRPRQTAHQSPSNRTIPSSKPRLGGWLVVLVLLGVAYAVYQYRDDLFRLLYRTS